MSLNSNKSKLEDLKVLSQRSLNLLQPICIYHIPYIYQMKMNLSLFQVLIALDIVGFTRSDCPSHTHTRTRTHALCWKMRVKDFYKISWELIEVMRVLLLGEGWHLSKYISRFLSFPIQVCFDFRLRHQDGWNRRWESYWKVWWKVDARKN